MRRPIRTLSVAAGALTALAVLAGCQTVAPKATRAPVDRSTLAALTLADTPYAEEATDWKVKPRATLLPGGYHSRTPATVAGARVIGTAALKTMIVDDPRLVLLDVVMGDPHDSVPSAVWLKDAGTGRSFDDTVQATLSAALDRLSGGDRSRPVALFCLSVECWLSYNATLRAVHLGYTNVYWYRGGLDAWTAAGLPLAPVIPGE
jgi:PQQ-dependent catabolism-associated CXXCW motif protein